MSPSRVSIKDIARAAGVSHSTVSRSLNNNPLISEETRLKIFQLSQEMGYTPDAVAQSLQTRQTKTIGVIVTSIADPFFAELIEGIEDISDQAGMSLFINVSRNDPNREYRAVETFHRRRVDGIICASSRLSAEHTRGLARTRVPVVMVNRQADQDDTTQFYSVSVDDRGGARLAVEHLLQLGHRRIGYLGMGNRFISNQNRLEGYRKALIEAGIAPCSQWEIIASADEVDQQGDIVAGQALFIRLLQAGVTAVFCYNDRAAVGGLLACRSHGIQIPTDFSLVGFDNVDLAEYVTPPLTTIHQPRREMGRTAMQLVLRMMQGEEGENHLLSTRLIVRQSTGPVPQPIPPKFEAIV